MTREALDTVIEREVYQYALGSWTVSWESDGKYRQWCHQRHSDFQEDLLVVMFNPGSLCADATKLQRDTTLRILREVCEPVRVNPYVVNLFNFATPSPDELFANWSQRDSDELPFLNLKGKKFAAFIMAYGDYENRGERSMEIKERISLARAALSHLVEIVLPKNVSGSPKHPITWQRQRLKLAISSILAERLAYPRIKVMKDRRT